MSANREESVEECELRRESREKERREGVREEKVEKERVKFMHLVKTD